MSRRPPICLFGLTAMPIHSDRDEHHHKITPSITEKCRFGRPFGVSCDNPTIVGPELDVLSQTVVGPMSGVNQLP